MSNQFHRLSKFLLNLSSRQACAIKIGIAEAERIDNFLERIHIGTNFAFQTVNERKHLEICGMKRIRLRVFETPSLIHNELLS